MKKKINLYFYYISRNILWSIFLILKEEKSFPRLIFIKNISRYNLDIDEKNNSYLVKIFMKIFFIKQVNLFENINNKKKISNELLLKINDIYENNVAFDNKSLFISKIRKINRNLENKLFNCYLKGEQIGSGNKKIIHYIFNGRRAPVFMFFEGLNKFAKVKRIEITYKNNKRHIFAISGYLWTINRIYDVEKKYGFLKNFSFYEKRIKGLDHDGKKFVKTNYIKSGHKNYDISLFLSTPYEFVGFSHTAKEYISILKFAFREIIKFNEMGYKCIIRNHPNFESSNYLDKKLFSKWFLYLRKKGIYISDYDEKVSSYFISSKSKINLVIGSTIGGELSFWGKNVYDFNLKSQSIIFQIVKQYDFESIIKDLKVSKLIDSKKYFNEENFKRFSGYNLGWGHEIPSFLQLGL